MADKTLWAFDDYMQQRVERWTIMLAAGELTPAGFKKMVSKIDVLAKSSLGRHCEERSDAAISIKLEVAAKASAQRLTNGIKKTCN
ncbi:MAG: hypothetical protein U1E51_27520 [Candidatus Binatia bacterium]|nr:hypothetical protein [Candidatus Binatia bacterium]